MRHFSVIMRILTLLVPGVAALMLATNSSAGGELERILSAHAPASPGSVIRGEFRQEKYLVELDQPLVSSGEFVASPEDGLIWRVREPVTSTMVVTRRHLVETVEGRETLRISAEDRPALRLMATAMLAVFRADAERLEEFFDIEIESASAEDWALRLRPRADAAAEFMDAIRIRGAAQVELVEVAETGGDRTVIRLMEVSASAGGLNDEERAQLEQ